MNLGRALLSSMVAEAPALPAIGQSYGGGYFAGQILVNGLNYALVLSPAAGEGGYLPYYEGAGDFTGNTSINDGMLIRNNMIAAGISQFQSQQFCVNLTIGGFTDWYLPSRDEMDLVYRAFKPTTGTNDTTTGANTSSVPNYPNYTAGSPTRTSIAIFQSGGAQALQAEDYVNGTGVSYGYNLRSMGTGAYGVSGYYGWYRVRAVRRALIP